MRIVRRAIMGTASRLALSNVPMDRTTPAAVRTGLMALLDAETRKALHLDGERLVKGPAPWPTQ